MVDQLLDEKENLEVILHLLKGLRSGELHITIHEGKIIGIIRTEKNKGGREK